MHTHMPWPMARLCPGLSPLLTDENVEKLKSLGVKTVIDFISEPAPQLSKRAGLPCEDIQSIRQSLLFQYGSYPVSARELWEEEWITKGVVISAGCPCLDEILDGGLICCQLTEICGPPASGKTQICLAVAGGVAMTTKSSVVYIDSGCGFSSTRLSQMLAAKGLNNEQLTRLLQRIRVFQVTDVFELLSLLGTLRKSIAEEIDRFHSNVHVVIIDAITFFISPLLGGRQFHGHALMSQVSMAMKELAYQHSIALLYSNNVVVDFGSVTVGGVKPALGRTWTYVPSTRIMLSQQESESASVRLATVVKSSQQPIGAETKFLIKECGLESFTSTRQKQ